MNDNFNKLNKFMQSIKHCINYEDDYEFPVQFIFHEGMERSKFKVTVEMIQSDTFVDSSGQTWKKV